MPRSALRRRSPVRGAARTSTRRTASRVSAKVFGRAGSVAVAALLLLPLAGLRRAPPLGGVRRRRLARGVRRHAAPVPLRAVLRRRLALAVAQARRRSSRSRSRSPAGWGCWPRVSAGPTAPSRSSPGSSSRSSIRATSATPSSTAARRGSRGSRSSAAVAALGYGFLGAAADRERARALAAAMLLLPTYVHGFGHWTSSPARPPSPLSDGLVSAIRDRVEPGGAVYADPEASYRIGAAAPVYICVAPPGHVADTEKNRPRRARPGVPALRPDRRPRDPARVRRELARRRPQPVRRHTEARTGLPGLAVAPVSAVTRTHRRPRLRSTRREGTDHQLLLPARGRRWRAASAQARAVPPGPRGGDARARSRRPTLGAPGQRAARADAGVGAPRPLRGAERRQAGRGDEAARRASTRARPASASQGRRFVVPDENATWALTAVPAAIKIVREHGIDAVLTTSPPAVGASRRRRGQAGDRGPLGRRPARLARRCTPTAGPTRPRPGRRPRCTDGVAGLVASYADAITCVSEAITEETRGLEPTGAVRTIANGCDFDDVVGLERHAVRPLPDHAHRQLLRATRPAAVPPALADSGLDVSARFLGDFREADRAWAAELALGDRLELIPYAPRVGVARAPTRLRGAAAADPRGRRARQGRALGQGVRVHRGRPADPRGRPARRCRRRAHPQDRCGRRRRSRRPRRDPRCARGAPRVDGPPTTCPTSRSRDEWRDRLARRTRVEETAAVLRGAS